MYYLRTKAAAQAIQFTVDKTKLQQPTRNHLQTNAETSEAGDAVDSISQAQKQERNMASMMCSLQNREECLMCGS